MNLDLVYPMAAMVLLTFFILVKMFRGRVRAVKAGEADAGYYKTYQEGGEPRESAQVSRHLVNLFESPTLFYAACTSCRPGSKPIFRVGWCYLACGEYWSSGSRQVNERKVAR